MQDKIGTIGSLNSDLKYLSDEYEAVKMWGVCPDGDVRFVSIMEWLAENEHLALHMIKVSKVIKEL